MDEMDEIKSLEIYNKQLSCLALMNQDGLSIPIGNAWGNWWLPLARPLFKGERPSSGPLPICIAVFTISELEKGWEPNVEGMDAPDYANGLGPPTFPCWARRVALHQNIGSLAKKSSPNAHKGQTNIYYFGPAPGFLKRIKDSRRSHEVINFSEFNSVLAELEGSEIPPNAVNAMGHPTIKF